MRISFDAEIDFAVTEGRWPFVRRWIRNWFDYQRNAPRAARKRYGVELPGERRNVTENAALTAKDG